MKRNRILNFFIPHYDELTLFVMSLVLFLTFLTSLPKEFGLQNFKFTSDHLGLFLALLVILCGALLSIFHAFSRSQKSLIEKKIMLVFAIAINGFAGVWGGTYMLMNSEGLLWIFPIFNILSSYLLVAMLKEGVIDEDCISNENIHIFELAIGTSISVIAFCNMQIFT